MEFSKDVGAEQSVVYVLEDTSQNVLTRLREPQQYAFSHNLPFAVVFCIHPTDLDDKIFDELKQLESELSFYLIPLIVLIGEQSSALATLEKHIRPKLFYATAPLVEAGLDPHNVVWPGTVQTVSQVQKYVQTHPEICIL